MFDGLNPRVTTAQCFDELLIPADHVSRRPSDTFYIDADHVLRPHTSAHQARQYGRWSGLMYTNKDAAASVGVYQIFGMWRLLQAGRDRFLSLSRLPSNRR